VKFRKGRCLLIEKLGKNGATRTSCIVRGGGTGEKKGSEVWFLLEGNLKNKEKEVQHLWLGVGIGGEGGISKRKRRSRINQTSRSKVGIGRVPVQRKTNETETNQRIKGVCYWLELAKMDEMQSRFSTRAGGLKTRVTNKRRNKFGVLQAHHNI